MEFTDTFKKANKFEICQREHSVLECSKELAIDTIIEKSRIASGVMMIKVSSDSLQECQKYHTQTACLGGEFVKIGMTTLTENISKSILISTPISPIPIANMIVGTVGHMKADQIGKSFGDLTIGVMDYLIDNIPSDAIDSSKAMILSSDQYQIEFIPQEVKFITAMVGANQKIKEITGKIHSSLDQTVVDLGQYRLKSQQMEFDFNETTRHVQIKLDDGIKLMKTLDSLPRFETHLSTEGLNEKISKDYVSKARECEIYNQSSSRPNTASVSYDDSHGWKIGFSVSYSLDGHGSGGGISCAIL